MCAKRERHCEEYRAAQESAMREWFYADTLHDVLACWGRLGGKITLHRHGREHYRRIGAMGGSRGGSVRC